MTKIPEDRIDPERLKQVLAGDPPFLAINLPESVAAAIELPTSCAVAGADWRNWITKVPEVRTILLWISPRREDDQEFLTCLAKALHPAARLHTFHSMAMMTVDRLTGDAVQSLMSSAGLNDLGCGNTGLGYYTRRYVRSPEAGPVTLPEWTRPPEPPAKAPPPKAPPPKRPVPKPIATSAKTQEVTTPPASTASAKKPSAKRPAESKPSAKKSPPKKTQAKKVPKAKSKAKEALSRPITGSKRK